MQTPNGDRNRSLGPDEPAFHICDWKTNCHWQCRRYSWQSMAGELRLITFDGASRGEKIRTSDPHVPNVVR